MKSKESQTDDIDGLELLLAPAEVVRRKAVKLKAAQAEVVRLKAALAQGEEQVKRLSEYERLPAETVASTDQVNVVDSEICAEHGYA